jgi:hypothetical protein
MNMDGGTLELKEQAEHAVRKMEAMQAEDDCSVPAEFETLILTLRDYFAMGGHLTAWQ